MARPVENPEGNFYHDIPAAGSKYDPAQPPHSIGLGGLPLLTGVDPRYPGCWRRLPGFHRISETVANSRLSGADIGGSAADQVDADYFKPIVVKYGSQPYERRGFVISASNRLVFKYYDTKTSTWAIRTLVSDLDASFGTRTNFSVTCEGRFLYVSRDKNTTVPTSDLKCPYVFWWDDDKSQWQSIGGGIQGIVRSILVTRDRIYVAGQFRVVGGSGESVDGLGYFHMACWSFNLQRWVPIGKFFNGSDTDNVNIYALAYWQPDTTVEDYYVLIGGDFTKAQNNDPGGYVDVTNSKCLCAYKESTGEIVAIGNGVGTGTSIRSIVTRVDGTLTDFYVGGDFSTVNALIPVAAAACAWYDQSGAAWNGMGGTYPGATVHSLAATTGGRIYCGGSFTRKLIYWNHGTAAWLYPDGTARAGADPGSPNNDVYAVVIGASNIVVFGGTFTAVGGTSGYLCVGWVSTTGTYSALFSGGGASAPTSVNAIAYDSVGNDYFFAITSAGGEVWGISAAPRILASQGLVAAAQKLNSVQGETTLDPNDGDIRALAFSSVFDGVSSLYAGGRFIGVGLISTAGIARWTGDLASETPTELEAQAGAARYDEIQQSAMEGIEFGPTVGWTVADLKGDAYGYQFFFRLVDAQRGLLCPPTTVRSFIVGATTAGDKETFIQVFVKIPKNVITRLRPTSLQLWRTIGGAAGVLTGGPFYLDQTFPVNPDTPIDSADDFLELEIWIGGQEDESLAQQAIFDPQYDLSGSPTAGSAIKVHKSMMFTLSGARRNGQPDRNIPETALDVRWSPPWVPAAPPFVRTEATTFVGFHRTRIVATETPDFIDVGDYVVLLSNQQLVRFQRQGDYVSINDGPIGIGVVSRHACCAVGGDLFFVSTDGEFYRLTVQNMQLQPITKVGRWIRNRFDNLLSWPGDTNRIMVGYDPASKMILITARVPTTLAARACPSEGLVMSVITTEVSTVADLSVAGMATGVDPETGINTLLIMNRSGVFLAPDWQHHGTWYDNTTWRNARFMTMNGATGVTSTTITGVTDLGGGSFRLTLATGSLTMDGSFGLALNSVVYLFRRHPSEQPDDTQDRYQLVFCGSVTAQTSTTIDVLTALSYATAYWRFFHGESFDDFDLAGAVIMIAPMLYQVGLPCPRDPREPNLWDTHVLQTIQASIGRFQNSGGTALMIPGSVNLDSGAPWRHDNYQFDSTSLGPILPYSEGVAGDEGSLSFAPSTNQDLNSVPLEDEGHHVVPILTLFSTTTMLELYGAQCEVIVDKDQTGIASA